MSPEELRAARTERGWSITEAVVALRSVAPMPLPAIDSLVRSWKRWEHGTQPSRFYRPLLERLFDGEPSVDVSGLWWAAWQSFHRGVGMVNAQQVRMAQHQELVSWECLDRGHSLDDDTLTPETGGYLWRGELRLWDGRILMGWYAADDGSVTSKGVVHLVIHPQGQTIAGRWVGLSFDGDHQSGWGALARREPDCWALMDELRGQGAQRG